MIKDELNILAIGLGESRCQVGAGICYLRPENETEAIRVLRTAEPDVVLLGWDGPVGIAERLLRYLTRAKDGILTVVVVRKDDENEELQARCAGAGIVVTADAVERLLEDMIISSVEGR